MHIYIYIYVHTHIYIHIYTYHMHQREPRAVSRARCLLTFAHALRRARATETWLRGKRVAFDLEGAA